MQSVTKQDHYVLDENIRLVPCRWSNTGWKYVNDDPSNQRFFKSPNRVNSHGWGIDKSMRDRKAKSVLRDNRNYGYNNTHLHKNNELLCHKCMSPVSLSKYGNAIVERENNEPFQSSYSQYYNSSK